jgi:uncharacterized membrane protein
MHHHPSSHKEFSLKEFMIRVEKKIYPKRYLILTLVLLIAAAIGFFTILKMLFFLILLAALNVAVSIFARHLPYFKQSIELMTFSTIIAAVSYGPKVGAIFGLISCILYYFAAGRVSFYIIVFAPLYALEGLIASLFSGYPIFNVAMTAVIIYTIISSIIVVLFLGARISKAIDFAVKNTLWNIILFKYIAPIMLSVMK